MASDLQFGTDHDGDHPDREDEWAAMRAKYILPVGERPASSARGVHHQALISSDVERTIDFYQGLLEFPLTELFQNRDYIGSTHFFFDIGSGNALAFFDFPGLGLDDYAEVLGGHHHLAISVERSNWERLKGKLEAAGVPTASRGGHLDLLHGPRRRAHRADLGPARRDVRHAGPLTIGVRMVSGTIRTPSRHWGATSWTSSSRLTLSEIMTLSPPSGTLKPMPNSLREIEPVALKPARVD